VHEYDEFTDRMARSVFEYTQQRLRLTPVPLDHSVPRDELDARAGNLLNAHGNDPQEVLRVFAEVLAPAVISCDSPRFLAFIPAAPTKASLLFDMVVSASSLQAISWLEAAGAVYAENQVLRFIADLADLPHEAGGCFVAGGSAGNLSALVVARETAKHRVAPAPARWRIAVSEQTHSSVGNALRIMDVDPLVVATDDERLTGATLQAALEADSDPTSVCAVVATAGTTNAGIIDDIDGVGRVAAARGIWLHVDAAYGGAALLAPSVRHRFRGIERADSLVVDPHKWLYAPFDCAALIYREPQLARALHTQDASYLDVIHERPTEWNPSDYAFHLTRRARGLPLWFSLAVHGSDAYRDAIETVLATARAAADRIATTPNLELVREPELSIVVFRRRGWGPDDYQRWSDELLTAQTAFVTPSRWHGETVARLAFLHPETSLELVDEILTTMT
ncbi:MAG: aromatic-L-amino-acid/L-tryptophan decarboxylase, partial [Actinomycetota bacterium]|jgi:glutamate/tyrosine decarboxylase-like PLP-dependent enzyme|nr:aromatic-L-amino-acid/L-tryptophan decarboxylase [Actinomycetota bacterium]